MQITPHFKIAEFGDVPLFALPILTELCADCLEPIREQFGPIEITSGNRPEERNQAAGGVKNSQHIYTDEHCAADWKIKGADMPLVFDWIRNNPKVKFDQLILEEEKDHPGVFIIHTSMSTTPRRMAMGGKTANQSAYQHFPVVPYDSQSA